MDNNIFMEDQKPLSFEQYLQYDEKSRSNLGETLPVLVYRMLEYSMKDELVSRLGKDAQIDIFRKAGQRSGEYFARNMLHLDQPLNQFISELQAKLQELKIGVLRIESVDEETGRITLTVSEDADCSGLPVLPFRYFIRIYRETIRCHRDRLLGNRRPCLSFSCRDCEIGRIGFHYAGKQKL